MIPSLLGPYFANSNSNFGPQSDGLIHQEIEKKLKEKSDAERGPQLIATGVEILGQSRKDL